MESARLLSRIRMMHQDAPKEVIREHECCIVLNQMFNILSIYST